jgi:hypothetical protein
MREVICCNISRGARIILTCMRVDVAPFGQDQDGVRGTCVSGVLWGSRSICDIPFRHEDHAPVTHDLSSEALSSQGLQGPLQVPEKRLGPVTRGSHVAAKHRENEGVLEARKRGRTT